MSIFKKLDNLSNRLKKIDINSIVRSTYIDYIDFIIDENQSNMLSGLDSKNISFRGKTNFYDLFETGDFQNYMVIDNKNNLTSLDWKSSMIEESIPNVFGLNKDNYLLEVLLNEIFLRLKKQING